MVSCSSVGPKRQDARTSGGEGNFAEFPINHPIMEKQTIEVCFQLYVSRAASVVSSQCGYPIEITSKT